MDHGSQTTTLSAFRFETVGARLWAFAQMGLARGALARTPDIGFWKLFGTGGGQGFSPRPNISVYAILSTWPSADVAAARVAEAPVFRRYRARAAECATLFLDRASVRGAWDGHVPFEVGQSGPGSASLAVLTRATIRPRHALRFWRHAPRIDARTAEEPGLMFKLGLGEVPGLQQVTFSIWRDVTAMTEFAYRHPFHREAARAAKQGGWFSEDLFARFRVARAEGTWLGASVAHLARQTDAESTSGGLIESSDMSSVS